ncbi:Aste57867_13129 [Aphanomyces stellatus]|uniref:Aste57867_13129 protein n=1 Tax=Aphanomyces stellatus TaxID=120398 RepID=A0A485KZF2_9STRA|nr:hypothetical protein As57867_013080 [Aphanomyces stellatus]VFT89971.1 Aste57867_13129 [Aphanomyces stellatus]
MADAAPPPPPPLPLRVDVDAPPATTDTVMPPVSPSSMADIDPAVLAELPTEIRDEVLASFTAAAAADAPAPPSSSDPTQQEDTQQQQQSWECPMCTFLNHAALASCELCEFSLLSLHDDDGNYLDDTSFLSPDTTDALRQAAAAARVKFLAALKTTNDNLHSASAALGTRVQGRIHQLKASLSPRSSPGRQRVFSKESAVPTADVCAELAALRTDLKTPCLANDTVYESLLTHLWGALTDVTGAMSFEREGDGWMAIGFQRINPDTDFRGGGLLALKCLVYVCHMHPEKTRFIFQDQKPAPGKRWYPVAVAGINLTCMLAGLLTLGDGSYATTEAPYWSLFAEPNAFFELYFVALVKMDQIWHRSHATYMQFGDVLAATKTLLRYVLAQGPATAADVTRIVDGVRVDDFKITRREEYFQDEEDLECPDPHHLLDDDDETGAVSHGIAALKYTLQQ